MRSDASSLPFDISFEKLRNIQKPQKVRMVAGLVRFFFHFSITDQTLLQIRQVQIAQQHSSGIIKLADPTGEFEALFHCKPPAQAPLSNLYSLQSICMTSTTNSKLATPSFSPTFQLSTSILQTISSSQNQMFKTSFLSNTISILSQKIHNLIHQVKQTKI
jgi:hypothetical protein